MAAHLPHPLTIDSLFDECLVPVLARVPLTDQLTSLPLTCTRWNSLLSRVHKKLSKLVICGPEDSSMSEEDRKKPSNLFHASWSSFSQPYSAYLISLFTASKADTSPDFLLPRTPLDTPLWQQLTVTLPNLTHLSLVDVPFTTDQLIHLLTPYRAHLRSLHLEKTQKPVKFTFPPIGEPSPSLHSLINSMSSLEELTLCSSVLADIQLYRIDSLTESLSTLLKQLVTFQLSGSPYVYGKLLSLNESKLKRLGLNGFDWTKEGFFSRLVADKPGLGSLTHLTLGYFWVGHSSGHLIQWRDFQEIAGAFPALRYLNIITEMSLVNVLKCVRQFSQLVTLKLGGPHKGTSTWTESGLSQLVASKLKLSSLRVLSVRHVRLEIDLLPLLARLLPKVDRLYLDECQFYCLREKEFIRLPSVRPAGCICKARLQEALATFQNLTLPVFPKIPLGEAKPK